VTYLKTEGKAKPKS